MVSEEMFSLSLIMLRLVCLNLRTGLLLLSSMGLKLKLRQCILLCMVGVAKLKYSHLGRRDFMQMDAQHGSPNLGSCMCV